MKKSKSVFSPTCCKEHQHLCAKVKHMDTSQWRFEDFTQQKLDSIEQFSTSSQRVQDNLEDIENSLNKKLKKVLSEDIEQIKSENEMSESEASLKKSILIKSETDGMKPEQTEKSEEFLQNLKGKAAEASPYLVLVNRLDEEEGVRAPSVEDKLKFAEDRLRVSTTEFCDTCEKLIEPSAGTAARSKVNQLMLAKTVKEAFRPKVFDPSLRPPRTLNISEIENASEEILKTKPGEKRRSEHEKKSKAMLKQGFYLPANTWFAQDKQSPKMSQEELELLNSTSTKAFFKFLNDRKKEPPQILQELQEKLKKIQDMSD